MNRRGRAGAEFHGSFVLAAVLVVAVGTAVAFRSDPVSAHSDQWDGGSRRAVFHGTKEFTLGGTFTVPDDVSTILVDIYGGGGGGGGQGTTVGSGQGGTGGAGAFSRSVIHAIPGSTLTVTIGTGGAAGSNAPTDGGDGGDSSISFNGVPLIVAYGGKGGTSGANGGRGGAGGIADPTAMISHAGQNGEGATGGAASPGSGYQPVGTPVTAYFGSYLGAVSAGGYSFSASAGQPGYVLLTY